MMRNSQQSVAWMINTLREAAWVLLGETHMVLGIKEALVDLLLGLLGLSFCRSLIGEANGMVYE